VQGCCMTRRRWGGFPDDVREWLEVQRALAPARPGSCWWKVSRIRGGSTACSTPSRLAREPVDRHAADAADGGTGLGRWASWPMIMRWPCGAAAGRRSGPLLSPEILTEEFACWVGSPAAPRLSRGGGDLGLIERRCPARARAGGRSPVLDRSHL
jgi:hypothetical protein